jgi:hypothetical protein
VGHYFIDNGGLVYMVLVRGTPAWYGEMSNWQIAPTTVGQTTRPVEIGGFNYDLALDPRTRNLTVLDQTVDLQKTNVIFLDRVGTGLVVRGGELMNLCWPSRPDAVGQVLSRSPAAVAFVTGIAVPPPKPPPARTRTPPRTRRR